MRKFTETQAEADAIDRELFRAMSRAEYMSENPRLDLGERTQWRDVYLRISASRIGVRKMMHPATRDETQG